VKRKDVKRKDVKRKDVKRKDVKRKDVKRKDVKRKDVKRKDVKRKDVKRKDVKRKDVKREQVTNASCCALRVSREPCLTARPHRMGKAPVPHARRKAGIILLYYNRRGSANRGTGQSRSVWSYQTALLVPGPQAGGTSTSFKWYQHLIQVVPGKKVVVHPAASRSWHFRRKKAYVRFKLGRTAAPEARHSWHDKAKAPTSGA
jgi:hypothetical protein